MFNYSYCRHDSGAIRAVAVAGIAAGQPFDTVKVSSQLSAVRTLLSDGDLPRYLGFSYPPPQVRLQADPNSVYYKGPLDCVRKTWSKEGILGFYKGMLSPIVANAPINALLFAVESQAQKKLDSMDDQMNTTVKHFAAG